MKTIQIQAEPFFQLLQQKELSMWEIFAQMIAAEEQKLIFLDENQNPLFDFILPNNIEDFKKDKEQFVEEFKAKLKELLSQN